MQTLISVFDDRSGARRAMERLVQAGFAHDDLHLQEAAVDAQEAKEIKDNDRGVLDSLGHFFVSAFGADEGEKANGTYGPHYASGRSILMVDARDDHEAETAAVILHDSGAVDVDDREVPGDKPHPGVRMYDRGASAPSLADAARMRLLRGEALADRAGQATKELKQDREERAYASAMNHVDRDRPK
jgi:hypothetical protein